MPTKETIFDNIEQYDAEDLVAYIKQGIVTPEELEDSENTGGYYDAKKRKKVRELLSNAEPNDWANAKETNTVDSYQEYINTNPNGPHVKEALNLIDDLNWANAKKYNTIEAYKNYLKENEDGKYRDKAREAIEQLENGIKDGSDKEIWDRVDKNSIGSLTEFIKNYPDNRFVEEAKKMLNQLHSGGYIRYDIQSLLDEIRNAGPDKEYTIIKKALDDKSKNIDIDDILDVIEDDNNVFSANSLKRLIEDGYLIYQDLEDIGISRDFVERLAQSITSTVFQTSTQPLNSTLNSTEIYFWGIPSSGKTCALGAILSVAGNGKIAKSMSPISDCQGYDYMNRLPQCFSSNNDVIVLPGGTPVLASYEMLFELHDEKDQKHPITCVDIAGEIIRCMYKKNAGLLLGQDRDLALSRITNLLLGNDFEGKKLANRSENRKIHFFVIEYGAHNRLYEGLQQRQYLGGVIEYIKQYKIFAKKTDAIYIIVTKADKTKADPGSKRDAILKKYIEDQYQSFYNGLKNLCKCYQINGGNVEILPFSLGEVCFQNFCKLNPKDAENIVRTILDRSFSVKTGKLGWLETILKG